MAVIEGMPRLIAIGIVVQLAVASTQYLINQAQAEALRLYWADYVRGIDQQQQINLPRG